METISPDWTSLPEHLLASISKRLHSRIDILRFRAVCTLFRSTLPRPPKVLFPPSILTTTDFLRGPNPNGNELFFLVQSAVYAIQPFNNETSRAQTWLVRVEETKPGKVQIRDPLSGYRFKNLSWKLPKSLNLLDYQVMEIRKSYRLVSAATFQAKYPYRVFPKAPSVPAKMIFSTCLDETDDGFAVMAKFGRRNLSMWRNIDRKWTNITMELESPEYIEDIVYNNHKFYVLLSRGVTMTVDSQALTVTEVAGPPGDPNSLGIVLLCLVESCQDLLVIGKYREQGENQDRYKVFKLDKKKCEWVPVDELGLEDRVLVMDGDGSYSVSAKEFPGCKGNCVYFTDDFRGNRYNLPGECARIFDLKYGIGGRLSDFPGYSILFWPPPPWLKQHNSLSVSAHKQPAAGIYASVSLL